MWAKINVIIFALVIAMVMAMPSKQDDENETSVDLADPCQPSPCGMNAVCTVKNNVGSCACLPEYFGNPYEGCRPECVLNSDCSLDRACIRNRCRDPCSGSCGIKAECQGINHIPMCSCSDNYTGDPYDSCNPIGNAYCVNNNDCSAGLACMREKCVDPCIGTCGENAVCDVLNHVPMCRCPQGRTGDPFSKCTTSEALSSYPIHPCSPSPCGPNSVCRSMNGRAVCSCLPTYFGVPPNCRPECINNSDCSSNLACVNQKCIDPCLGSCGRNAQCKILNYSPICSCPSGTSGDPFIDCKADEMSCLNDTECSAGLACMNKKCVDPCIGVCGENAMCKVSNRVAICQCPHRIPIGDPFVKCTKIAEEEDIINNPCLSSSCGPNSVCRLINGKAMACTCLPEFLGLPPNCRPECVVNTDCSSHSACINRKCVDPCPGTCGSNATCTVVKHIPVCFCPAGMTGDPFVACQDVEMSLIIPCSPTPCGPNSQCRSIYGKAVCSCLPDFLGMPPNCRAECLVHSECPSVSACFNQKCVDPCPGSCGYNATCKVLNHSPICSCPAGTSGNPFIACKVDDEQPDTPEDYSDEDKTVMI